MKLATLALSGLIALLGPGLAHAQTSNGLPPLPPVPKTGQLSSKTGTSFTFIVAGDNRPATKTTKQPATLSQIFSDAQRFNPAFFIWCGDTISGHTPDSKKLLAQYRKFIEAASKAKVPVFNAPGNHEMDTVVTQGKDTVEIPNEQMFGFYLLYMMGPGSGKYAFGAFNYGNSRFIAMNTEEVAPQGTVRSPGRVVASGTKLDPGYVGADQMAMLTQDLENNKGMAQIFVFMHHPIKPSNSAAGLDSATATALENLFAQYHNVAYVLAAHEHLYYNANSADKTPPSWTAGTTPPVYLVTGGAGAPLDKCSKTPAPNTYCDSFNHYLVFTVTTPASPNQPSVTVQLVEVPTTTTKKTNGGK